MLVASFIVRQVVLLMSRGLFLPLILPALAQAAMLTVSNPDDVPRPHAIAVAPARLLGEAVRCGALVGTLPDGTAVPVQVDDLDGDDEADELCLVVDLQASESLPVSVNLARPWTGESFAAADLNWLKRNWAVLDNDRLMYRLYEFYEPEDIPGGLQWDCYGKRPDAWRLSAAALATVNYHADNPVGVDFLKIGSSLGLGGPILGEGRPEMHKTARYAHRILANGPVRAGIEVRISEWTTPAGGLYEAVAKYFLYAHSDVIDASFVIRPQRAADDRLGFGIVRHKTRTQFIASEDLGILAAWGQQDTIFGESGLAVLFHPSRFYSFRTLPGELDSEAVLLNPGMAGQEQVEAHVQFIGVWQHGGLATAETFVEHVRDAAVRFQRRCTVEQCRDDSPPLPQGEGAGG